MILLLFFLSSWNDRHKPLFLAQVFFFKYFKLLINILIFLSFIIHFARKKKIEKQCTFPKTDHLHLNLRKFSSAEGKRQSKGCPEFLLVPLIFLSVLRIEPGPHAHPSSPFIRQSRHICRGLQPHPARHSQTWGCGLNSGCLQHY
jgi:hypothetical protein